MTNGAVSFDQRPGDLEATRAAGSLSAAGVNTPAGWRVGLMDVAGVIAALTPAQAMALSIELGAAAEAMHALLTTGELPARKQCASELAAYRASSRPVCVEISIRRPEDMPALPPTGELP